MKRERVAGEVLRERRPDKSVCSDVNESVRLHSRRRAGSHTSIEVLHLFDTSWIVRTCLVESERERESLLRGKLLAKQRDELQ